MNLKKFGYNAFFEKHYESCGQKNLSVGRISSEHKNSYKLFSENGEIPAFISGKFRNTCEKREDYPAVGDWVFFDLVENRAIIQSVFPRMGKFSRKVPGKKTEEQIIAANVDTAFIVCSLNYDFNPRRIERYLSIVWESGANPVIVLTKLDLCADYRVKISEVEAIAFGVDVYAVSNISQTGIEELKAYCSQGNTIVLLGSSGAGKSSLINNLFDEELLAVQKLRKNIDKGKHTTTSRQMLILPQGGLIIDTPGMRELQLWNADEGVNHCFEDIEKLAKDCLFSNCSHQNEPECAVKEAINNGGLDPKRLESYLKLQKELEYMTDRQNQTASQIERKKWKNIKKQFKHFKN